MNAQYSLESLEALAEALERADELVQRLQRSIAAARDTKAAAARDFHYGMIGAKTNVTAKYGPDSPELQAMGLKKKSEYKRPGRRQPKEPAV